MNVYPETNPICLSCSAGCTSSSALFSEEKSDDSSSDESETGHLRFFGLEAGSSYFSSGKINRNSYLGYLKSCYYDLYLQSFKLFISNALGPKHSKKSKMTFNALAQISLLPHYAEKKMTFYDLPTIMEVCT